MSGHFSRKSVFPGRGTLSGRYFYPLFRSYFAPEKGAGEFICQNRSLTGGYILLGEGEGTVLFRVAGVEPPTPSSNKNEPKLLIKKARHGMKFYGSKLGHSRNLGAKEEGGGGWLEPPSPPSWVWVDPRPSERPRMRSSGSMAASLAPRSPKNRWPYPAGGNGESKWGSASDCQSEIGNRSK